MLGLAFEDLSPGNAKTGIRLMAWQFPTMAILVKWGKEQDSTCMSGDSVESAAHVMLRCETLSHSFTARRHMTRSMAVSANNYATSALTSRSTGAPRRISCSQD